MIERNRFMDVLAHTVLILGVMVVAFPVYLTFVASTHTAQEVVQVPMPLWPGEHLLDNYKTALFGDAAKQVSDMAVARMMWVSLVSALCIAIGKISISLLSAFAIVYFRLSCIG